MARTTVQRTRSKIRVGYESGGKVMSRYSNVGFMGQENQVQDVNREEVASQNSG